MCGKVEPLDDGRKISAVGNTATRLSPGRFPALRRLQEECGADTLVIMDTTPAPATEIALATAWRAAIGGLKREVVDLERQLATQAASPPPAAGQAQASSAWVFEQYAREVAGPDWQHLKVKERPEELKTLLKVREKFINAFPTVPMDWPPIRDWLYATWPGDSRRTRRNMFDVLKRTFSYAAGPLRALPHSPLDGTSRPKAKPRPSTPLSEELLIRCHDRAMQKSLRDFCIWLLRFAQGWRPVECTRLLMGHVRQATAKADGYIMREQKHRPGMVERSVSPILSVVLEHLRQLWETLPDLADDDPIFRGQKGTGRHQGKPLEAQGVRNVIRKIFDEAEVRAEIPDVIPYDLRDSFAVYVGRSVVEEGGSVWVAEGVTRGLLGHGDGEDSLKRYWNDDLRHLELAKYSPIRLVVKNGGESVEIGGIVGGDRGARTPNLGIANAALSQLSYIPVRLGKSLH